MNAGRHWVPTRQTVVIELPRGELGQSKLPMNKSLFTIILVSALCVPFGYAAAKDDVKAAAAKLANAPNYTWTSLTEIEGGQFTPSPVTGKAEKGGFAVVTQERDGNVSTAVIKGDKGVVKTDDGWKTAEELRAAAQGGGGGGGGMRGWMLLRSVPPADQAAKLADQTKELKAAEGAIGGELTEEGAKELMSFGRARGGQAPEVKNAKGSIKYWVKDGQLVKMQLKVSGTFTRNNEDRDMTRITTYEIKDVGTTKVEVPAEAKSKLSS